MPVIGANIPLANGRYWYIPVIRVFALQAAPEEINLGTGERLFYYLNFPLHGTNLPFKKGSFRHKAEVRFLEAAV
jgi:hypothetical protein